jgi:hypothetical protein
MKLFALLIPLWIVREEIVQQDIVHPEICFAQFILETGHGKSFAFRELKNTHGWTGRSGLMRFDDWRDSIKWYKRWQKRYTGSAPADYFSFLKKYWGAPNMDQYINKVKSLIK